MTRHVVACRTKPTRLRPADRFIEREYSHRVGNVYGSLADEKLSDGRVYAFRGIVRTPHGLVEVRFAQKLRTERLGSGTSFDPWFYVEHIEPVQAGWFSLQAGDVVHVRAEVRPASAALSKKGAVRVAHAWARQIAESRP